MRIIFMLIFLTLLFILFYFLKEGLKQDPKFIPSPLLNQTAPNFVLPLLNHPNKKQTEKIFLKKCSLLQVWASWCTNCSQEPQKLFQLKNDFPLLQIIGLNYKDNLNDAKKFIKNYGNPYEIILIDKNGDTSIDYGVYGTPESFLIDPQGKIIYKTIGSELNLPPKLLKECLAEST